MNRRNVLIILIIATLLAIVVGGWFLGRYFQSVSETLTVEGGSTTDDRPFEETLIIESEPAILDEATLGRMADSNAIERMGRIFAEKYGSYSNQTDFSGMRDLNAISTNKLQEWLQQYQKRLVDEYGTEKLYSGVTTSFLTLEHKEIPQGADRAEVFVTTQREFFREGIVTTDVKIRKLRLNFVKYDGIWYVDGAFWL